MRISFIRNKIGLIDQQGGKPMGLKERREQRDMTQTELAKRTGIAQTTISGYENGRRNISLMSLGNAVKISHVLNCQPEDLLAD